MGSAVEESAGGRYECGVCWHVYDPALGDPAHGVAPGTRFDAIPGDWRCPVCDAETARFLALDGRKDDHRLDQRLDSLLSHYRHLADTAMRDVPICNFALSVRGLGFRPWAEGWLGVVVTPWFLNAVLLPRDPALWDGLVDGTTAAEILPSGQYEFLVGRAGPAGVLKALSIFSPPTELPDDAHAEAAALAVIEELCAEPEVSAPSPALGSSLTQPPPLEQRMDRVADPDRRALLFGRSS
ncbi:MAG: [NiFe]-hydrogenase assembly chaperone HybE [Alphaproteobacteria bacterium]|nr:[NiFe]-hydrogenase assembly chaperone HybE [Alphaproteobacteria bacterium]